ncbi:MULTISPECIES: lysophospholipid acyltransferase family protein [Glutamicibacter]|uniref:1-acyl-sn-glycerol-3-phosphate acyltransferase n=1 Tax=Glutamicibacter arilaitensis TaxID=256701 RepID=A0A2N7S5G7_9MICC|nr:MULTISPECIES: lysophospholipid acyltransferase family protein [Glutamicibacter]PMQ21385.1 1-acyl-sn-glycerol-3-phosphate acyltransferase [Glutamicibacter arilaitensis]TFH57627.1 1-acyl-sn-glycerol-3-phosphate acyltransferase [Glutamicibacter arilaitensis]HCJ54579.1 1-acyl-sn-glycerol-3-phosphate acyltransferase [Glutamicibacter sp.]HCM94694.1 1-acyl-sn-glycerol-3-phosphate acyltransferase [Glutamicibacter sp.]
MLYDFLKRFAVRPLIRIFFRVKIQGIDNVPESGAAILASNHLSVSDSVFLPAALDRPVIFLAKDEYFNGTGLKGRITAWFFRNINQLPMDRSGGKKSAASLASAKRALDEGKLLGIYPEGTRSPDGRLYRAKLGVAKLALESGAPVIPIAMINTDKVQPINQSIPRPGKIGIKIGKPLAFEHLAGKHDDPAAMRACADEIRKAINVLSGQSYVDIYAPRKPKK